MENVQLYLYSENLRSITNLTIIGSSTILKIMNAMIVVSILTIDVNQSIMNNV
jgi:hypothetical protein